MGRLLIYGATGTTGERLAGLAVAAGIDTVVAGRRAEEVQAVAARVGCQGRVASLGDLARVLEGVDMVASCIAPYTRLGPAVVTAAVEAGAHYLDLTGEPHFVQYLIDRWDTPARARGLTLVPSAGLGVCSGIAARAAVDALSGPVRDVVIGYQPQRMRPSTGTMRSALELLSAGAIVARGGRTRTMAPGSRIRRTPKGLGTLFPLTDPLTLHTVWPEADIAGYYVHPVAPVIAPAFLALRATGKYAGGAISFAQRRLRAKAEPAGGCRISVRASDGRESRVATADFDNLYELTARAALEVVQCLQIGTEPGIRAVATVVGDPGSVATRMGARLTVSR